MMKGGSDSGGRDGGGEGSGASDKCPMRLRLLRLSGPFRFSAVENRRGGFLGHALKLTSSAGPRLPSAPYIRRNRSAEAGGADIGSRARNGTIHAVGTERVDSNQS